MFSWKQQLSANGHFASKMSKIFPKFALKHLGTFFAIIVIFLYDVVFNMSFNCSCGEQVHYCNSYMALPCCSLIFIQLWMDKTLLGALKFTFISKSGDECCKIQCRSRFFCVLLLHFIKALFVGVLWVVVVLIDGDWYVCCKIDPSDKRKKLPCRKTDNITLEEHKIIADLKNESSVSFFYKHIFTVILLHQFSLFVLTSGGEKLVICSL